MDSFRSISKWDLQEKIQKFYEITRENDPETGGAIVSPCKLEFDDNGTKIVSTRYYNESTYSKGSYIHHYEQKPYSPSPRLVKLKAVGQITDEDTQLVKDIYSTLSKAINSDDTSEMEAWLAAGGNVEQVVLKSEYSDGNKGTLFSIACMRSHIALIELLLRNNADINQLENGVSALYRAVSNHKYRDETAVIECLLGKGAGVDTGSETPLFKSVELSSTAIMEKLLNAGADVNLLQPGGDHKGESAFYRTFTSPALPHAKLLLQRGAYINQLQKGRTSEGASALSHAVYWNYPKAVEWLIQSGADIFHESIQKGTGNDAFNILAKARERPEIIIQKMAKDIIDKKLNDITPAGGILIPLENLVQVLRKQ